MARDPVPPEPGPSRRGGTPQWRPVIEAATDNLNRTAADMRSIFTKSGGSVADPGSVAYQFDRKGEIRIAAEGVDEEAMMDAAITAGADDVQQEDDEHVILTDPTQLAAVADSLREQGFEPKTQKLVSLPQNPIEVDQVGRARQVMSLYDKLDDHADVIHVFTNFDVTDEVLAQLED